MHTRPPRTSHRDVPPCRPPALTPSNSYAPPLPRPPTPPHSHSHSHALSLPLPLTPTPSQALPGRTPSQAPSRRHHSAAGGSRRRQRAHRPGRRRHRQRRRQRAQASGGGVGPLQDLWSRWGRKGWVQASRESKRCVEMIRMRVITMCKGSLRAVAAGAVTDAVQKIQLDTQAGGLWRVPPLPCPLPPPHTCW